MVLRIVAIHFEILFYVVAACFKVAIIGTEFVFDGETAKLFVSPFVFLVILKPLIANIFVFRIINTDKVGVFGFDNVGGVKHLKIKRILFAVAILGILYTDKSVIFARLCRLRKID